MKTDERVRTRHDEWAKRASSHWLERSGGVRIESTVAGESRRIDILFTEEPDWPGSDAALRQLGVLGQLARGRVAIEVFSNAPTTFELKNCVLKAVDLEAHQARARRRAKKPRSSVVGPTLVVIMPSMSSAFAVAAGAQPVAGGTRGLYTLAPMWRATLVVVNELPVDASTLWLRLLGRGMVQMRAVQELQAMSEQDPLRDDTLRLLIAWQQSLPPPEEENEEERELRMNWERVYERWEQELKEKSHRAGKAEGMAEGKAEGMAEGKAEAVLAVLDGRGLAVTAAQRKLVLSCTDGAQLDAWLRAAGTAPSVKELLSINASPAPREKRGRAVAHSR